MTVKEYHIKYFNEILENKKEYQEKIVKFILKFMTNIKNNDTVNWSEIEKTLNDYIYSSLAETLSSSLSLVKEAYGIKNKKLNLKELTWQEDGKTIEDRIHSYCYGVKELVSTADEAILKRLLVYNMTRLLDTETIVIHNRSVRQLLEGDIEYAEVLNGDECCEDCEIHFSQGKIPIADLELPPYHPDCECYVIYYLREKGESNES